MIGGAGEIVPPVPMHVGIQAGANIPESTPHTPLQAIGQAAIPIGPANVLWKSILMISVMVRSVMVIFIFLVFFFYVFLMCDCF